jgi:hypothetical protein
MIRLTRIRRYFTDLRADAGDEGHWPVRRSMAAETGLPACMLDPALKMATRLRAAAGTMTEADRD